MSKIDYEKYLVRKPLYRVGGGIKGRQSPVMTYMSNDLVPGCDLNIELGWIHDMPEPNPHILEHAHDYDEIILYISGDPYDFNDLGGDIEYYVGGQPITFDNNASFYIPKGVKHGPVIWKKFRKPHLELSIMLGPGSTEDGWASSTGKPPQGLPQKKDDIDYEKYLVREPLYLGDRKTTRGGMSPVRMVMCNELIPDVNVYIDYPWLVDLPETVIPEHVHEKYNEVVLHIGGDPNNPEDLGAEVEYYIDGQLLTFNETTALYMPKGVKHGPLTWKKFSRPHIQMPIIIGGGTLLEAAPAGYKEE
jgi:hypothetical protein